MAGKNQKGSGCYREEQHKVWTHTRCQEADDSRLLAKGRVDTFPGSNSLLLFRFSGGLSDFNVEMLF
jgi:hypothetical protein